MITDYQDLKEKNKQLEEKLNLAIAASQTKLAEKKEMYKIFVEDLCEYK